jgi:hypothetical protein
MRKILFSFYQCSLPYSKAKPEIYEEEKSPIARRPSLISCSKVHRIFVHPFVMEKSCHLKLSDSRFSGFFHESIPPAPEITSYRGHFEFLQKLAEIFESKGWALGSMTPRPAINGKMFEIGGFFIFC